ncbi:MAG: hypothetical protein IKO49_06940 [Bacilli bacterium]|nr:hypothetical protein [Bacilli bacterium]
MEIYKLINNLKDSLDKEEVIINIKNIQNNIKNDIELVSKIKNKDNVDDKTLIREYKHLENGVNYIIFSINKELKSVFRSVRDEGHSR